MKTPYTRTLLSKKQLNEYKSMILLTLYTSSTLWISFREEHIKIIKMLKNPMMISISKTKIYKKPSKIKIKQKRKKKLGEISLFTWVLFKRWLKTLSKILWILECIVICFPPVTMMVRWLSNSKMIYCSIGPLCLTVIYSVLIQKTTSKWLQPSISFNCP